MGAPKYTEVPKKNKVVQIDVEKEKQEFELIKEKLISVLSDKDKVKKAAKIIEELLNSR